MTAPTGLGQYNKPQGSQGDRVQAQQMVDRPILVWVRKLQHLNRTKFSADGGDAIYIDFVDLLSNQVYIEVMWMAGAIVDGLKQYAGDGNAYPVKVVKVQGGQWGSYQTIESLSDDPQWMAHIQANLPVFQQLVAQTRAQKEAEWATAMAQAQQPPPVPNGPPAPALAPVGAAAPPFQQPGQQAQYGPPTTGPTPPAAPPAAPGYPQQQPGQYAPTPEFQQAAAQYGVPQQQQQQAPPAAAPQYQPQQAPPAGPPPAAPPAQQGYQPQQYAPPAQAAVAPPQYPQQAAPPGPPPAAAPPQQFQQAGPPAAPPQYAAGPPGLPQAPGAVTGQTVEQLQAALNQIG